MHHVLVEGLRFPVQEMGLDGLMADRVAAVPRENVVNMM